MGEYRESAAGLALTGSGLITLTISANTALLITCGHSRWERPELMGWGRVAVRYRWGVREVGWWGGVYMCGMIYFSFFHGQVGGRVAGVLAGPVCESE